MAKKKVTRKELLKESDEFLTFSSRAIIFAREHSRHFQYVGIGIVVIILLYLGINTYLNYINKKGQAAYNKAYYTLTEKADSDGADENPENLKKSEELFEKVIDKYGLSKVSRLAQPELGNLRFRNEKYDEAITHYEAYLEKISQDTPYQSLAKLALAGCYEAKGELDKAVEVLESIMSSQDDYFKEQAMIGLARVYRLSNRGEKSDKILKEFVEKFDTSPFLPFVKGLLAKNNP